MMANRFGQFLGLRPEAGQQPSGIEFNDYLASISPTNEQQREASTLAAMDNRIEGGIQSDLAEADAVRSARNLGFEGTYPLREQADYTADQKLRQILAPKQMEMEAELMNRDVTRQFQAEQAQKDRDARAQIAAGTQAGQMNRVNAQQGAINARAQQTQAAKQNPLSKLFGWMTGSGEQAAPAAPSGPVTMMDPSTGETRQVPAELVQQYLSRGAQVVN